MKLQQANLFGIKRIEFNEQVQLTVDSLNTYGPMHDHWAIAWSMGKDSTTLLTLTVQLIESGQIKPPKSLTVLCADTRLELIPLWLAAKGITEKLRGKGIEVRIVMAKMDKRFFVLMFGRGIPPSGAGFRWCTGAIKITPMEEELRMLHADKGQKILMLTGVRQGESAIRDGRIAMSCGKDGAECGQGWYQIGLDSDICSTLAPILHWRVCTVWDWLKIFAPSKNYGGWPTAILADAYGGDEAEEINARTGCMGCPVAQKDKALESVVKLPEWSYLSPLLRLRSVFDELRSNRSFRKRHPGGETTKDGSLVKNQQRLGPLTMEARLWGLNQILQIQLEVNEAAIQINRPQIDILNEEEVNRIHELIEANTWPDKWTGEEPTADAILDKRFADGSVLPDLFKNFQ
jgi:DNA sulfur modification protein DndC